MLKNQHTGVACGECGADMVLRESRYGWFYGCIDFPRCKGTHGAHPNKKPLGIPANKETKLLRIEVHAIFNTLWPEIKDRAECSKRDAKREAYWWLTTFMDMAREDAHVGRFTADECRKFLKQAEDIDINEVAVELAIKLL